MNSAAPVVFVVDDDDMVRDTVSRMVTGFGFAVETFASAESFLRHPLPDRPSCLVLDVMMPGSSGFDVVAALTRGNIEIPTIFMTGEGDIPMSVRAMKAGAVEFLTKPLDKSALREAVKHALDKSGALRARRDELRGLEERLSRLTQREREVLTHVVAGRLNKQIAADLGVVEQTIKLHRAQIMRKLGADSVADLVRLTERVAALRA